MLSKIWLLVWMFISVANSASFNGYVSFFLFLNYVLSMMMLGKKQAKYIYFSTIIVKKLLSNLNYEK